MPVQYNNSKIIPAPFVSVEKNYDRTGDGHKIGSRFTLTVRGTIITCGGSPNSCGRFYTGSGYPDSSFQNNCDTLSGLDERQKFLQNKMQAIRHLFAKDGLSFEVQPWDGSAPMKCYPRIQSLNFDEGNWVDRIDYTIVLEADEIFGINTEYTNDAEDFNRNEDFFKDAEGNKLYLSEVSESWQLEQVDGEAEDENNLYTFRLTHSLSATGKRAYDDDGLVSEGWEQAKRWVTPRLGIDNNFVNGTAALNLSSMLAFNHSRQENTNELDGSYEVNETWVLAKGNAREDFTITTTASTETGLTTVSVEGEVIGLDSRDNTFTITESKWTAALAKFNSINSGTIFTRAQTYSGISLNATALSSTIGKNPLTGRIQYNYQYDTRPTNCIAGALTESIIISDNNPGDVFAAIPVIGRQGGPVLQDMNTFTERKRTVQIDVNVTPVSICPTSAAAVTSLMAASPAVAVDVVINAFEDELESNFSQVFRDTDNPSWNPKNGKYSRSVTWTYGSCL